MAEYISPNERVRSLGFADTDKRHQWIMEHLDELRTYYEHYGRTATEKKYHIGSSTMQKLHFRMLKRAGKDKEVSMNIRKDEAYKLFAEGYGPHSDKVKALLPYAGTRNLLYQAWKRGKCQETPKILIPGESQEGTWLGNKEEVIKLPDEASILDNFISMIERAISTYRDLKAENQQLKASNRKWQQMAGRLNQDIQSMIHSG